jgi:hypothetical protein
MNSTVQIVQTTWGDGCCIREDIETFDNLKDAKKFVRDWKDSMRNNIELKPFLEGTGYFAEYFNADCSHCVPENYEYNGCVKRFDENAHCPEDWYERMEFLFRRITPIKVGEL